MVKIINIDDPHVDSTSVGGWDQKAGMHSNWVEAQKRLGECVDAANDIKADFFVVGGDLFDNGKPTAEAVGLTKDNFERLHPDCTLILLDGNHDQQTVVSDHRTPIAAYFGGLKNVVAVSRSCIVDVDGMQFASVPWLRVAGKTKVENASDELKRVVESLGNKIKPGPSMFAAHMVVDECTFDNGMARGSEMSMATSLLEAHIPTALIDEGPWSIARLGHIHKRQQLSDKTGYGGSIYKVSFGEHKEAKGYDIIEIDDKNNAVLEFGKLDVRELIKLDLSARGNSDVADIETVNEGDIVRIVVDYDDFDSLDVKNVEAKLDKMGISHHIERLSKPRREIVSRVNSVPVDASPLDGLNLYMSKYGIEDEDERNELLAELNRIMSIVGTK